MCPPSEHERQARRAGQPDAERLHERLPMRLQELREAMGFSSAHSGS
ncbi:MAG: hypothetical protein IPK22_12380 [Verrucomicrobiaceae bacterium]|nr:hypothetical protein [Verrucomicrobiaceae bacterium]